jgi:hypothetical protein
MTYVIQQLNTIRDPLSVERILIANSRTEVREVLSSDIGDPVRMRSDLLLLLSANKPFVIRQGGREWAIVKRFNDFGSLLQQAQRESITHPDRKYTVYKPDTDGYLNQSHAAPFQCMTFLKFLTTGKKDRLYLLGVPDKNGRGASPFDPKKTETDPPIFAYDIDSDLGPKMFTDIFADALSARRHVFFNSGRSYTNLHYDTDWNMYLCAVGKRRWYLAHPDQARILGASNGGASYSNLHPNRGIQGLKTNRLAHLVKFVQVDLDSSDLLFVPPTWWHVVEAPLDEFSSGINWFFTYPTISTKSHLDGGWTWATQENTAQLTPSAMGALDPVNPLDGHDPIGSFENQPDVAGRDLNKCVEEGFVEDISDQIKKEYKCHPEAFGRLQPQMAESFSDYLMARQLVSVAFNSCRADHADSARFDSLCCVIADILAKRLEFLPRRGYKRSREGSEGSKS